MKNEREAGVLLGEKEWWGRDTNRRVAWVMWQFLRPLTEVKGETWDNMKLLDAHLKKGSVVVAGLHWHLLDAVWAPVFFRAHLHNLERAVGPLARKHYEGAKKLWIEGMARGMGVHAMPVVRTSNEREYETYKEEHEERVSYLKDASRAALSQPGGMYGLAPWGRRVDRLFVFENDGVFSVSEGLEAVAYTALSLTTEGWRMRINMGEPFFLPDEMNRDELRVMLTDKIAALAPLELARGYKEGVRGAAIREGKRDR